MQPDQPWTDPEPSDETERMQWEAEDREHAAYRRGLADGHAQAAEGLTPEVEYARRSDHQNGTTWYSEPYYRRDLAETHRDEAEVVMRRSILAGPWEPTEPAATPEGPEGGERAAAAIVEGAGGVLCGVPNSSSGLFRQATCKLAPGHPGWHEDGSLSWLAGREQVLRVTERGEHASAPTRRRHDPGALIKEPDQYDAQEERTILSVPDSPKMLRETLCIAQAAIGSRPFGEHRKQADLNRLQRLINECDRHRPLGSDGKHGDHHTPTCGCDPDLTARAAEQTEGSDR